jgi:hypothetical protein
MVARMGVRVGYVVHLHHIERGAQDAWRRARRRVYGGYLGVQRRGRGWRSGGVENAQPGVGVRLLGRGGRRARRVWMRMLARVDAHVLVESGRR